MDVIRYVSAGGQHHYSINFEKFKDTLKKGHHLYLGGMRVCT